jgi:hypothetical protein
MDCWIPNRTFHAHVAGPTEPLNIRFYDELVKCSLANHHTGKKMNNNLWFIIDICPTQGKECQEG